MQILVANEVLYNPATVAIKTSILLLYRRIFTDRGSNPSFNVTLWCTGSFILSYSICQAVLAVFYCKPVKALWDHQTESKCINFDNVLVVLGSLNIGTDIFILCLPVPQLWKLVMSKRQKCNLIGIFLLGGLFVSTPSSGRRLLIVFSVCLASIIRVPYVSHMSLVDASWSDVYGSIWTVVELNLGIVSACLPTLRPLFLHVFHGGYTARANRQKLPEKPSMVAGNESPDFISMTEALDTTPIVVSRTSDAV